MFALRNLGLPSDYASAGTVQTATFKKPADAYSKSSVFAAQDKYAYQPPPNGPAVGGQCPPGTVQQGLVCAQLPQPDPPVQPPPHCPGGMYWNGGECAPMSPPPPLPGPASPPTPFWDVGQTPTPAPNPPPAGTVVNTSPMPVSWSIKPSWKWIGFGLLALGVGAYIAKR